MVLHHIAHCARCVIIGPAPTNAHSLRHSDLDMIDILRVPQRFKQQISKAHGHEILDSFLAQIMVNPVDLAFIKLL